MIKKVVYFIILIIIVFMPTSYAETENTIQEQQETFGINTFIEEAEEYTGEFFEDIDKYDFEHIIYEYFSNEKKTKD